MKSILSVAILLGLAGAGGYYYYHNYYHNEGTSNFRLAPIERGNMLPTIEATGTVEPEQVVDIGSQVNGLVTELKADYGSNVEKNTVLATIDKTLYQAAVDQGEAALMNAKATLRKSKADLGQMKANMALAEANLQRDEELRLTPGALAPNQYDTDFAAVEVGKANVLDAEAVIGQAEAAIQPGRGHAASRPRSISATATSNRR